jgi:hypothetical protein
MRMKERGGNATSESKDQYERFYHSEQALFISKSQHPTQSGNWPCRHADDPAPRWLCS